MPTRRLVPILLFLSGASALIYEVVWSRLLTFTFGGTAFAISTVLAAYMAGLALGSWVFGRRIDRGGHPLAVYAALEAGIAVWALLLPLLLAAANGLYRAVYSGVESTPVVLTALRFGLSFLLLVVPTALMGGTLPVLLRLMADDPRTVGSRTGLLLGSNTVGAVAGTLVGGFVLIPALGLSAATIAAVVVNLLVAFLAWSARKSVAAPKPAAASGATGDPAPTAHAARGAAITPVPPSLRILAVAAYALSGCAALMCEVAWTRVLAGALGTTTYAFSTMLATFLLGLALGSFLFGRLADRGHAGALLAWTQLAAGVVGLALIPVFGIMPRLFLDVVDRFGLGWGGLNLGRFALCSLAMLGPTILFGGAFPLVARLFVNRPDEIGRQTGQIYAANTAGAIVGSLLAGFVLIPAIGRQGTLIAAAALCLVGGFVLLVAQMTALSMRARLALGATLLAVIPLVPGARRHWDEQLTTSGAYAYASSYAALKGRLLEGLRAQRLVEYREDTDATLAVWQRDHVLSLRINGKADASTGSDMLTQKLLAHVPLLYHPEAKEVCIIGLGSGVSVGSALAWSGVQRVDCVELLAGLKEMARHFAPWNGDALADPRTRLLINDGRNHLLLTKERYDVIVSEPSNPWISGIGSLFTREFFRLGAARLNDGGVFCQWVQTYQMSTRDLGSIVKTFHEVFPETAVWMGWPGDLILVGRKTPLVVDYAAVETARRAPRLKSDLEMVGIDGTPALLAGRLGGNTLAEALASAGGRVATDDNLLLEFSMPRHLARSDVEMVRFSRLAALMTTEGPELNLEGLPADSAARVTGRLRAGVAARRLALDGIEAADSGHPEEGARLLRAALDRASDDPVAGPYLGETLLGMAQRLGPAGAATARPLYEEAAARGSRTNRALALNALAATLAQAGQVDTATALWREALALEPKSPAVRVNVGFLAERTGDRKSAEEHYRVALEGAPRNPFALAHLASLLADRKQFTEALRLGRLAVLVAPNAEYYERLGWTTALAGDQPGAEAHLRQALKLEPDRLEALFRLGMVLSRQGKTNEARAALTTVAQRAGNSPLGQMAARALQGP